MSLYDYLHEMAGKLEVLKRLLNFCDLKNDERLNSLLLFVIHNFKDLLQVKNPISNDDIEINSNPNTNKFQNKLNHKLFNGQL
jgi:hypothetical protein